MTLSFRGGKRQALRLTAVLAVSVFALAACGSDSDGGDASDASSTSASAGGPADFGDISVQLSWIKNSEFAGEFIADDSGYYKDAGFSSVNLLPGPVAQEEIVATGKAEFGLSNAFLKANDIDPSCLTIVPNSFDVSPLEDKQIDGLVAYLTNESLLVKGHGFDTVDLPFADNGLTFVAETVTPTDDMIANKPDEVKAFLK